MAFMFVPNGKHMADWTPKTEGKGFELPFTLQPLAKVKDSVMVLTGLTQDKARPNGDGAGDHARSTAAWLTGCQPRKTAGADIKAGISVDQLAAQFLGKKTRFASLEIGCERGAQAGNCDSGYSCAYSSAISWRSENTPVAKEVDPKQVFERLFGNGNGEGREIDYDIDRDGSVTPLDVLVIINAINNHAPVSNSFGTSGDQVLSPLDVLVIINFLNRQSQPNGEGESSRLLAHAHPPTPRDAPDRHGHRHVSGSRRAAARGGRDNHAVGHQTEEQRKRYRHLLPSTQQEVIMSVFGEH